MQHADVVIIGAGVAGLTAAMIAAGHGARTLVVEQLATGGQVATIEKIRNLPGFPDGIAGYELGPLLLLQSEAAGAAVQLDCVSAIAVGDGVYRVICAEDEIVARAVIIAAGSSLRKLGISGEAEFAGRGMSHCAACDGRGGRRDRGRRGGDRDCDPPWRQNRTQSLSRGVRLYRAGAANAFSARPRRARRRRPDRHRSNDAYLAAGAVCRRRHPRRFGEHARLRRGRCRHRGNIGSAISAERARKQK